MIIQLYIQDQRVELFKDESVTITDSIQNVKDIDKVFTAFSQSFSIPASKTNNKIFKHYYNFDIDGGFDARKKVAATIELNNLPFRTGKIKLEGVDLKNNNPHTYRITFFGDIVDLKDKLGEKKLSDLDLTAYDIAYDATNIENKLTEDFLTTGTDIICPLITHSQRLYYDSGTGHENEPNAENNIYYDSGTGHKHGVKWNELKYAIRVNKIIEAIEADFGLQFSSDFFKNTSIDKFDHLFLWLHRKSGKVENLSGNNKFETLVDGWAPADDGEFSIDGTTFTNNVIETPTQRITTFELFLSPQNTSDIYDVRIERDGEPIYTKSNHSGTLSIDGALGDFEVLAGDYDVFITASTAITFLNILWYAVYRVNSTPVTIASYNTSVNGNFVTDGSFTFNVSKQIPDIKILDFLTGLFRLFNLTAYVDNGVIVVKPLDDFFTSPTTYDITEFIDVESSKVDVALPFKEVLFKFKDTGSFLAQKFGELNNREWGSTFYKEGEDLSSGVYKVEVPFGHMLYERLTDQDDNSQTYIQYGWCVDKSQNAYLGSPLLFYPINLFIPDGGMSFVDAVNSNNEAASHKRLTVVNMPHNTVETLPSFNPFQLNFNRETSEWAGSTEFNEDIFTEYYSEYIKSVFNPKQRLTKVKAFLPMRILLNYSLGDRFVIAGNQYKINSVSTNLLTGESNLELINDL